jgi:aldehyde:ferredoxin oxidoreductase
MSTSKVGGYAGKFLKVNMTSGDTSDVVFDEKTLRMYLGGTGIGAKVLYEEVPPKIGWHDPENRLIIASGPLGGTPINGSGTVSIVTKGTMTGGGTSVQANGRFGAFMKFAGYDGIIIHGASKRWMYLHVENGKATLREASHLLGRDTYETADLVRGEWGKSDTQMSVTSIGPAGEHLARFACIFLDKGHAAGHNGTGAVMGSKKLKAIAVERGNGRIEVVYRERLVSVANNIYETVKAFTGTIGGVYRTYKSGRATLPIKNYTTNIWDIPEEKLYGFSEEYIRKSFEPKPHPCWACRLTHSTMMRITQGPYEGTVVEEPEYEQMAAWGPVIGNEDAASAMMLSGVTDRVGLENNEAGWLVGWLMECYERGLIKKQELDGLEMSWGNVEATRMLLHMIANRQGVGDLLAEGVMRASQKIGGEAAKCAIYTMKGNTPRGHDHRSRLTEMFDTCTSNTGTIEGTPQGMWPATTNNPGDPEYWKEISTLEATIHGTMQFEDSLGACGFNLRTLTNMPLVVDAVGAATGWDFTQEEAKNVGLRAANLFRAFNMRCGIDAGKDFPSERYGSTPSDGPYKGISLRPQWKAMLENYYTLMGWDPETGKPLQKTLKSLGLEHVVKDIYG